MFAGFGGLDVGTAVAFLTLDRSKFDSDLRSAKNDFKNAFKNENGLGRITNLGNGLDKLGNNLTKHLTLPMMAASKQCVDLATQFENSIHKVNTIAKLPKNELKKMRQDILDASRDEAMDASKFADATYQAISSSVDVKDSVKFTKKAADLALGGQTDISVAVDSLTSVMNTYGKTIDDVTDISNKFIIAQNEGKTTVDQMGRSIGRIIPTCNSAGMKIDELLSTIATTTAQGQDTAESITGIGGALANIVKPSDQARKAAQSLGIEFDVNALKTKGWMPFLQEVRDKLSQSAPEFLKVTDQVNKLKAAIIEAEKEKKNAKATKQNNKLLIQQERDKIRELRKQKKGLTKESKATKGAYEDEIIAMQNHIDLLSQDKKGNKIAIREARQQLKLLKEKNKETKKSNDTTKDAKDSIDSQIEAIENHIRALQREGQATGQNTDKLRDMKKELREKEKTLEILGKTSGDQTSAMATMFGSMQGLNTVLALTSETGLAKYNKTMKEMKEDTDAAKKAAEEMKASPAWKFQKAKEDLQHLKIELGGQLLPYVVKAAEAFSKLINTFEKLPNPIKDVIMKSLLLSAALGPVLKGASKICLITGKINKGILKIPKGITKIIGGFTKLGGKSKGVVSGFKNIKSAANIFKFLPSLITPHTLLIGAAIAGLGIAAFEVVKHWDGIKAGAKKVFGETSKIIKTSIEGWKMMFHDFKSFAGNVWDGFKEGIKTGWQGLKDGISEGTDNIKKFFKDGLEIHSPSHFTQRCGIYWNEGFEKGIDKNSSSVFAKLKNNINKMKELSNVNSKFHLDYDFDYEDLRKKSLDNSKSNSKTYNNVKVSPNITMYVTLNNDEVKQKEELTTKFKQTTEIALKDAMTKMFMDDAIRD